MNHCLYYGLAVTWSASSLAMVRAQDEADRTTGPATRVRTIHMRSFMPRLGPLILLTRQPTIASGNSFQLHMPSTFLSRSFNHPSACVEFVQGKHPGRGDTRPHRAVPSAAIVVPAQLPAPDRLIHIGRCQRRETLVQLDQSRRLT